MSDTLRSRAEEAARNIAGAAKGAKDDIVDAVKDATDSIARDARDTGQAVTGVPRQFVDEIKGKKRIGSGDGSCGCE